MENKELKVIILNLTGDLEEEMALYFTQRGIQVVNAASAKEKNQLTHILTKDIQDFTPISNEYQTSSNDIKIISLTYVNESKNFIEANGKLVFDQVWLIGPLGNFILDKFFQEYAGITMGDNYPKFQEVGFFNVTNPFTTGDYLDRLVHKAFEQDFSALSVKTYFDHIIMYLAGLKTKGKVGLPIEVTYGMFDDVFGLQLHFFAESLKIEDITSSLSKNITRNAEASLLNISIQSSDFFDFTFLAQVNKVVITALWTKDERLRLENKGMMFTSLSSAASIVALPYEGLSSQLMDSTIVQDMSSKVNLPDIHVASGLELSETLSRKIASNIDIEQIQEILKGDTEEEETKIVLKSNEEMEEILNIVKGSVEKEAEAYKVSGRKLDVDNFVMKISAGISEKTKGNLSYTSLGEKLPEVMKTGLFDFAIRMGKDVEDLSDSDINVFKTKEVPTILKSEIIVGDKLSKQFRKELKSKLEDGIRNEFGQEPVDMVLKSLKTPEDEMRLKTLLKDTLKSSLETNFKLDTKSISEAEKDHIVKSLSDSLSEEEETIRALTVDESELFGHKTSSATNPELEQKLKASEAENENLKSKMKTLMTEVKILKDSRSQVVAMNAQIKQASAAIAKDPKNMQDEQLRKHFQERLAKDELLNQQEQKKLALLLDREAKLVTESRRLDVEFRKMQFEAGQKEILFSKELEKVNRDVKNRDLLLDKLKESMAKVTDKKDAEISELRVKIYDLGVNKLNDSSKANVSQLRDLEKQNQSLEKMVEMYKTKVASMVNNLKTNKDDDGNSKDELRRLQMINNQFKNQVDASKKEIQKYQDKITFDLNQINKLRADKASLDAMVKKLTLEAKKEQLSPQASEVDPEIKKMRTQNQLLETQLKEVTSRFKDAETRLAEAQKSAVKHGGGADDQSKKLQHLETSMKKISGDLVEARNQATELKKETTKLRHEKTALQNQLDKFKKDPKAATPQKPGTGGKAA